MLYTPVGSHGHRTALACPETREELADIAQTAAGGKLRWHDGNWTDEGPQRDSIHSYAPDADVILVLDADEVWGENAVESAIAQHTAACEQNLARYRVSMIHYWRSFYRAILHDPAYPIRVIYPQVASLWDGLQPAAYVDAGGRPMSTINHMGYAQSAVIVDYKMQTHGHKDQFRTDCNWFWDIFMANRQTDLHPVGSQYWNSEPVNPLDFMPSWMAEHPYYGMEIIP